MESDRWPLVGRLAAEYRAFVSCPKEVQALLFADSIYAFVLPIIEIFVAAYVLHNSHNASTVLVCQLAIYVATPIAFLLNGFLLRGVAMNHLYAAGMFLSGGALLILTVTDIHGWAGVVGCGGLLGFATGIYWANRGLLAVASTNDQNRNYFYGVETAALTLTSMVVPWCVGTLIERMRRNNSPQALHLAYQTVAMASLALTLVAAVVVSRGKYPRPMPGRFVFFRFERLWRRMLVLAALRGLAQGYIITAPALLILRLVGQEGTLGRVEAVGSCLASACFYGVGRISKPKDRVRILAAGVLLFLAGAAINAVLFNASGVLMFMGCLLLAKPLIDLAYNPLELRTIDVVSSIEGRGQYAYVLNHEMGVFVGRFVGCILFIGIAVFFSETYALRYALLIVAVLQVPIIGVARKLPL